MSLIVTSILPKLRERPPLTVSPWIYNPPRYMFFSNESTVDQWVSDYTQEIIGPNGLGTFCLYGEDGTRYIKKMYIFVSLLLAFNVFDACM